MHTKHYSEDILWRIVWLRISQNLSHREIAQRVCIGLGTVGRTVKRFKTTGQVSNHMPKNDRSHLRKLDELHEFFILDLVFECSTIQLSELCEIINKTTNTEVSVPTLIRRTLKRYGLSRKKIRSLRARFMAEMLFHQRQCIVWIDETGSDKRDFLRKYGHAKR